MISRFGQEVELEITDAGGKVILKSSPTSKDGIGLRVDFDLRIIYGFSRGTISIYNLSQEMIKEINNGERYVTLKTRLHDEEQFTLATKWYVSNSMEERKLPNSITTLYCFNAMKKTLLEKVVNLNISNPSLDNVVKTVVSSVGFNLGDVEFKYFPDEVRYNKPLRNSRVWNGSVAECLNHHSITHKFLYFTHEDKLTLMYKPNLSNIELSSMNTASPDIILDSSNMRANPKIGVAELLVTSNLDGRITPTTILDISKLITAGTSTDEQALQLVDRYLEQNSAGYTNYAALAIQHKGSNYTSQWETLVTAISPDSGTNMPTVNWFR